MKAASNPAKLLKTHSPASISKCKLMKSSTSTASRLKRDYSGFRHVVVRLADVFGYIGQRMLLFGGKKGVNRRQKRPENERRQRRCARGDKADDQLSYAERPTGPFSQRHGRQPDAECE